jgi:hypothetical protein
LTLLGIIAQWTVYLSALTWLAWRFERLCGLDAFHLVVPFTIGVLAANWLASVCCGAFTAIAIAAGVAWALEALWSHQTRIGGDRDSGGGGAIVHMIAAATLALLLFDWVTAYTSVSFGRVEGAVPAAAGVWLFGAGLVALLSVGRGGRVLRLGTWNRWAPAYWGQAGTVPWFSVGLVSFGAWYCVIALPLTTTGVLSSTLLKDVAMAVLLARAVGTRGPAVIVSITASLAVLRVSAGYLITSPIALPAVDASIFVALFLWLRYRGARTAWSADVAR